MHTQKTRGHQTKDHHLNRKTNNASPATNKRLTTCTTNRGAELLYGDRKQLSWSDAASKVVSGGSAKAGLRGSNDADQEPPLTRSVTEEERARLKERYSMEYSRYIHR